MLVGVLFSDTHLIVHGWFPHCSSVCTPPQEEEGVSEMSDWDRYASDQYEILQAEEANEQENEYVSSPSPILFLVVSLPNCVTHSPLYIPRFEDEGENGLKEDKNEMLALLR